jgi:hypothetical protein
MLAAAMSAAFAAAEPAPGSPELRFWAGWRSPTSATSTRVPMRSAGPERTRPDCSRCSSA